MASQGPNSGGTFTGTDTEGLPNTSLGQMFNPSNVAANDGTYQNAEGNVGANWKDGYIKLIVGGSIVGNNKATGSNLPTSDTAAYTSYGGSSDLWGATITAANVNATTFGVAISTAFSTNYTKWLKVTNFGFSVPAEATIDGVLMEVNWYWDGARSQIDHVRITVYYTEAAAGKGIPLRRQSTRYFRGPR